ncbi:MAG: SDR family NAD(P)-dependent oxidoreductase [Candidatus Thiodiazotropha endolucinida]
MSYRTCALVTGATGAIGGAITKGLAADGEREVVLVVRNQDKAERAVQRIRRETGNAHVRFELADLSRDDAIRDLAARWKANNRGHPQNSIALLGDNLHWNT